LTISLSRFSEFQTIPVILTMHFPNTVYKYLFHCFWDQMNRNGGIYFIILSRTRQTEETSHDSGYLFRFISNYYFSSRSGNTDHLINGLLLFREELKGMYLSLNLTALRRNTDARLAELYQAYEEEKRAQHVDPRKKLVLHMVRYLRFNNLLLG